MLWLYALLSIKRQLLQGKNVFYITEEQYNKSKELMAHFFDDNDRAKEKINGAIKELLHIYGVDDGQPIILEKRVADLITMIREKETAENTVLETFCKANHLSKSRLLHLFKEELGISYKKYLQYQKFFKTWRYLAQGENITSACIHAGYSDSAHYSKFMKQCYGMVTKQELTSVEGVYWIGE